MTVPSRASWWIALALLGGCGDKRPSGSGATNPSGGSGSAGTVTTPVSPSPVEAQETRSDSDFGNAGVYAIDVATHQVVFADPIGKDIAGGQRASEPVFDGNQVFAIAGGKLHAYRVR